MFDGIYCQSKSPGWVEVRHERRHVRKSSCKSNRIPLPPRSLTLFRLAPRRGKKQAKRNLPQLMTAARHQLRRAMPASVPSRLPASYLPPPYSSPGFRILQTPLKKKDVKRGGGKGPRGSRRPSCPGPWRRIELKAFLQVRRCDDWGFIFLSGFFFFCANFGYLSGCVSAIPICAGNKGKGGQ